MKKNFERFLAFVLVMVMVFAYIPAGAFATESAVPALPTATVSEIKNSNLTFAMNFKADTVTDEQLAYYGDWYADFELTVNKSVTFNANGGADGYLSGQYDAWSENWVNVPFEDVTLEANKPLKIMEYAAKLMGESGLKYTYGEVYTAVKNFDCGVFFEPEFLAANSDLEVTLELKMYDPENEDEGYTIGSTYTYTLTEEQPAVPTATVTEVQNEDLTFALNFKADEVTDEQLAYYGKWFADFELTVNKEVTFNANGGADGYLSGQYDAWSENWVNVPFEDVTLEANKPLKIMEYASKLMGEEGLKLTYNDIVTLVKDFDCGVFFEPDFLAANPDLEVTLELKMYDPKDEKTGYIIGESYNFGNSDFLAKNVETGKNYSDVSKALEEAASGQTVILLKDAGDMVVTVLEGTTLDLNGFVLDAEYVASFGDIIDGSEANSGRLMVDAKHFLTQKQNAQLPVKTAEGYLFADVEKFNERYTLYKGVDTYLFQPFVEAFAHTALMTGKAASGVTVEVEISWKHGDGKRSQNFEYNDENVQTVLNDYNPATGKYNSKAFTLVLSGAENLQNLQFQVVLRSETGVVFRSKGVTLNVTDKETEKEQTLTTDDDTRNTAYVPEGVLMEGDAEELKLTTSEMSSTTGNIVVGDGESLRSVNVHVEGLSENNTVPLIVTLNMFAPEALNEGNLTLYHMENGETKAMTRVYAVADVNEHNEYYYEIATGNVTMALATFSEIAARTNDAKVWNGNFNYDWYFEAVAEGSDVFEIYNADQLAGFGAIVGGMAKDKDGKFLITYTDSDDDQHHNYNFAGKTVKLMADINLADAEDANDPNKIFYPIGYWNNEGTYERKPEEERNTAVSSGFYAFEGTFDGNGNTISNFYQNTWEMKGDHNWYDAVKEQYYRDGMGLFGWVKGGTVKNLTVENFSCDGEIATTGVIAAYADSADGSPATFENIAIVNCNPRVYNIGNGGIVGCAGWFSRNEDLNTGSDEEPAYGNAVTFRNITVDQSNKISALWGTYDASCGGILGQYYPNSGCGIVLDNCHVAAVMDVNNDVCGNYQYYWYRYSGMFIGTVRGNVREGNYIVADPTGITAENCTYTMGDWSDYWYCELVKNTQASYTHDHQFSRLTKITSVSDIQDENGNWNVEGNFVIPNGRVDGAATCYHIFKNAEGNLYQHFHDKADESNPDIYESFDLNKDGVLNDLKEDRVCYFIPFNQMMNGLDNNGNGYGVKPTYEFEGMVPNPDSLIQAAPKFKALQTAHNMDIEPGSSVTLGELVEAVAHDTKISKVSVSAFASPVNDTDEINATFVVDVNDWRNGTLTFDENCCGEAIITITDYYFCTPVTIRVTVGNDNMGEWH